MKAITQQAYGPAEALTLAEIDRPAAGDHQVLVRVRAAAVNPADVFIMRGAPYLLRPVFGLFRPRTRVRGTDFAGVVEAVGPGVTTLQPGDEVFGSADGAFAEYVCAKEDAVAPKPAGITFEQAAAIPIAGLTALQGLRDVGKLASGQRILVVGAGGGVGSFAVQIAKAMGAEVTGVCSPAKVELVRSLGADHVIDYTRDDVTGGGRSYDLILDNAGGHSFARLRRVLAPRGTFLPNSGKGGQWIGPLGRILRDNLHGLVTRQQVRMFVQRSSRPDLVAVAELVVDGKVTPVVDRTYPLAEAPEALRYVEQGHAAGKVVLTV